MAELLTWRLVDTEFTPLTPDSVMSNSWFLSGSSITAEQHGFGFQWEIKKQSEKTGIMIIVQNIHFHWTGPFLALSCVLLLPITTTISTSHRSMLSVKREDSTIKMNLFKSPQATRRLLSASQFLRGFKWRQLAAPLQHSTARPGSSCSVSRGAGL